MLPKVSTMGDPHLGRRFKTGVPLHRIGEREASVWKDFRANLMAVGSSETHVCMGDIFDKFVVAPEIVLRAVGDYKAAAFARREVEFIVLRGNHDVSRDTDKKSSFDLFKLLVEDEPNITVVDEVTEIGQYGFVPFCPFTSAEEQCLGLSDGLTAVFMHHDYVDWGGEHVIPTKLLKKKKITKIINGHDHLARSEKRHGVTVEMVGSLQPYSHAEDDGDDWYITVTLDELCTHLAKDKNVRVLLKPGESLPTDLDCLSLTAKRITDEDEKLEVDTSDFDNLDLNQLLGRALDGLTIKEELMTCFADYT